MRTIIYQLVFMILMYVISGCSDFLKESSQDEVRPSTVNDLEQLMLYEAYPLNEYFLPYLDLLTDDAMNTYSTKTGYDDYVHNGQFAFTWTKDMFEQMKASNLNGIDTWERYYKRIKGCNVILDMLDDAEGSIAERGNLKGQALALRAYYYFMLVNLFGQPYNAEGVDIRNSPGVPLILNSRVSDDFPRRASVARVYEQVEKDLLEAAPLMEQYGKENTKYKVTDLFVHALLSRVYLYMENWDKSVEHADYVIKQSPALQNLAGQYKMDEFGQENVAVNVYDIASVELIWAFSTADETNSFFPNANSGETPIYSASDDLMELYEYDGALGTRNKLDLRYECYYQKYLIGWVMDPFMMIMGTLKGNKSHLIGTGANAQKGIRVAEMYLNRAECFVMKYLESQDDSYRVAALKDLNYLRENRYDTRNVTYVPREITDGQELLNFYREERRRELSFEEHRWFDLRRYGMPELRHTLTLTAGQPREYILEAKSDRYVLPISQTVLERNPALEVNP